MSTKEYKAAATATTATELGQFEAIAATWQVDRSNEQIRRGAFKKSIAQWQAAERAMPLHWDHRGEAENIIGSVDPGSMRETAQGLFVAGRLDLEGSAIAREAWRLMKANSIGLSFGYLVLAEHERADGVRELHEIDLFEISLTASPVNAFTRVLAMKSLFPLLEDARRASDEEPDAAKSMPAALRLASFEVERR